MAIQANDIAFSFGPRFTLAVPRFTAGRGECVGIIGANGSGKSTLLKLLFGLLPLRQGTIVLDGEPLDSYSWNRRARHMAYVPQSHLPTFAFTVEQTVLMGRMPYRGMGGGFEKADDIAAAESAIQLMELEPLRHETITRLSGGELQRVMIAKALAQSTGTIILDEPNTHLDIGHQLRVLEIVRRHAQDEGLCVIASIHDLNLASIFSDRLVMMRGGTVTAQGAPADVLREGLLAETFGADMVVEPAAYGEAPAVRYRYRRENHVRNPNHG
ncbi:MAG: ABC transporter ATP-binding protein [Bacteroidetes bacterium]|nr:ABC transporter ATP-binding protein [Bacteroidota bacterium]